MFHYKSKTFYPRKLECYIMGRGRGRKDWGKLRRDSKEEGVSTQDLSTE